MKTMIMMNNINHLFNQYLLYKNRGDLNDIQKYQPIKVKERNATLDQVPLVYQGVPEGDSLSNHLQITPIILEIYVEKAQYLKLFQMNM